MAYAAVQFSSDQLDVGHHQFTFVQTGADTGSLDQRLWAPGDDPTGTPTSDKSYELTNIRAIGNTITADGPHFLWVVPKIKFRLSAASLTPSIEVTITGAPGSNSDTVYALTAADHAAVEAFLVQAGFPS